MVVVSTDVLIVDDDAELAGSLGDYLSELGFRVDFAFDGKNCLDLAQSNHYDIIILDVSMPVMDGLKTCRELRTTHRVISPIIFLTARDTLEDKLAGFREGGDDYLVKPFSPAELVCRIEALLRLLLRPPDSTQLAYRPIGYHLLSRSDPDRSLSSTESTEVS